MKKKILVKIPVYEFDLRCQFCDHTIKVKRMGFVGNAEHICKDCQVKWRKGGKEREDLLRAREKHIAQWEAEHGEKYNE